VVVAPPSHPSFRLWPRYVVSECLPRSKKGNDVWCTAQRGTTVSMPIMLSTYADREVAVAKELSALRTALAEHEQVSGFDRTARQLREMISDRQRFLSRFSSRPL
jgi:hypothetical protein